MVKNSHIVAVLSHTTHHDLLQSMYKQWLWLNGDLLLGRRPLHAICLLLRACLLYDDDPLQQIDQLFLSGLSMYQSGKRLLMQASMNHGGTMPPNHVQMLLSIKILNVEMAIAHVVG